MCLKSIIKRFNRPKKMRFYKVFKVYSSRVDGVIRKRIRGFLHNPDRVEEYVLKKRYRAYIGRTRRLYADTGNEPYKQGFHGFLSLDSAKIYFKDSTSSARKAVYLCEGGVHTLGRHHLGYRYNTLVLGDDGVVAHTMTVLKKIPLRKRRVRR